MPPTPGPDDDAGPSPADLAAIEHEWPLIAAELDVLDAEIAVLNADEHGGPSPLDWRRLRRATARVTKVAAELATRPHRPQEPRRTTPAELEGSSSMTDPYAEIAAELRRIADDLTTLAGKGLPKPWFNISIQPATDERGNDDVVIPAVDAVAVALLGRPATTDPMSSGGHMHRIAGTRGPVSLGVHQSVSSPEAREREAELARLRAELDALRTAAPAAMAVA